MINTIEDAFGNAVEVRLPVPFRDVVSRLDRLLRSRREALIFDSVYERWVKVDLAKSKRMSAEDIERLARELQAIESYETVIN